jgi:predicted XRE-type DNA-binding protein
VGAKSGGEARVFDSVWDEVVEKAGTAARMRLRLAPGTAVREVVQRWGGKQVAAARRVGVAQPRPKDLLRGRMWRFSLWAFGLAERAGSSDGDFGGDRLTGRMAGVPH